MTEKTLKLYKVGDIFLCHIIKGGSDTAKIIMAKEVKKKGKDSIQYSLQYSDGRVKRLSDAGITDRIDDGLWKKMN